MKKKILIVDDEKNIRISLQKCFSNSEYETEVAVDGVEAVEKIKNKEYDLILMDIQMPKKNGLEVLIESRNCGISTEVIMMTAFGSVDIAVDVMKLGAVDFISKPFTVKKVKQIVKEAFNKQSEALKVEDDNANYIEKARESIRKRYLEKARMYLKKALVIDTSSAEIQNLLGVIEEKSNNKQLAQKHYRAALSLDATYSPADNNLKRTVLYSQLATGIDLG